VEDPKKDLNAPPEILSGLTPTSDLPLALFLTAVVMWYLALCVVRGSGKRTAKTAKPASFVPEDFKAKTAKVVNIPEVPAPLSTTHV
jgi:hypothetical protein